MILVQQGKFPCQRTKRAYSEKSPQMGEDSYKHSHVNETRPKRLISLANPVYEGAYYCSIFRQKSPYLQ